MLGLNATIAAKYGADAALLIEDTAKTYREKYIKRPLTVDEFFDHAICTLHWLEEAEARDIVHRLMDNDILGIVPYNGVDAIHIVDPQLRAGYDLDRTIFGTEDDICRD